MLVLLILRCLKKGDTRKTLFLLVSIILSSAQFVSSQGNNPYDPQASLKKGMEWHMPGVDDNNPNNEDPGYIITSDRLEEIRGNKMYPFFDRGGGFGDNGDFQLSIRDTMPQINKQLNFLLPFYGFGFNYTWLSLHGALMFSEVPVHYPEYPLQFPIRDYDPNDPTKSDPSFIGIFYSRCKVGELSGNEVDEYARKRPGVYFRQERDLYSRKDQFGVELRERAKWDLRQAMVGTETFLPKHIVIATWKNVSFAGGIPQARRITNTFQLVLITDEVRTYAMFIYDWMGWTTHTEAGGDTTNGEGGTPAFVGFNAGNGTHSHEYKPYSQNTLVRDLPWTGWANGFLGRHVFRVDEKIIPGVCIRDLIGTNLPLTFAPENGHMLGGTLVNITGPCFKPDTRVTCRFNNMDSEGVIYNENRAGCVMPWTHAEGWVDFEISLNGGPYYWKGQFFVEPPNTSPQMVWFDLDAGDDFNTIDPQNLMLRWDPYNLTMNLEASVTVSLWGYREDSIQPELLWIDDLEKSVQNKGMLTISPKDYHERDNGNEMRAFDMGLIMVNLTNPVQEVGLTSSPTIWSRPMPLGWYFAEQWRRYIGNNWQQTKCDSWVKRDRMLKRYANELPMCPCLLRQALVDRGRYAPDFECDQDGNTQCYYHQGAQHCVATGIPNHDGAGQQCCYDLAGYLMMTSDNMWGGKTRRYHNLGLLPWNEANKIPTLSHYLNDVAPFFFCCLWQGPQQNGCQNYRFERRISQDCVGYQPPGGATVFGDPHVYTFDGKEYTFNGKGEYVLVRADSPRVKLDVQGRFEQVQDSPYGTVYATALTSIAAKDNVSATVEVRMRPYWAQWRYKLDVLVNSRHIYFDRYPQKIQHFPGVTVYTPSQILNQSHVIMMFKSGAGVEVIENKHYMAARVFLPWEFINMTRGLMGNWTFDIQDDFTLPDGSEKTVYQTSDLKNLHEEFAMQWILHDMEEEGVGKSLFTHSNGQSSNTFYDDKWRPEYLNEAGDDKNNMMAEIPDNVTWVDADKVDAVCGESYQCKYDYSTTLNMEFALFTKYYQDQFINIREGVLKPSARVVSCGILSTPGNGRKSTFAFTPGTMVKFDCDPGYVLTGERRRWCYDNGDWNWAENGEANCLLQSQYNAQKAGITSAIVIAVLLPIGICGFCLLLKLRQNASEKREDKYYNEGTNNTNAPNQQRESRPMNYEPNITNSGPGTNRSSASSGKKKIGRGDSSDDRDSGIQTTEVKLHDDGRVTTLERDKLQQQDPKDSPISSLKNGMKKPNGIAVDGPQSGGSRHGSLSGGSKGSRQPSKDEFLLDLENDRGENEMIVGNPTFNEVVARRSPVGIVGSIGSAKNGHNPSLGSGSSGKGSSPRVPLPTGITSSSDSSNLPSSARSSSRSNIKEGGPISVPLQKQSGPTLIGVDKYPNARSPMNDSDASVSSPAPSDSRYDGVYYTREPLNDKPKEDFPTKTMDVDIDFSSYKPHGNKPSVL